MVDCFRVFIPNDWVGFGISAAWCWTPWEYSAQSFLKFGGHGCCDERNGCAYIPLLEACLDDVDDR